jgi:small-conductance mechanosensitive channel
VSLFASAGVAGLIIGLAAQKVIGSILAGFQLAITQPIRIDDVVIVENEWGWIEEITLTYVVIRLWDKRRLVVPTTYFIEKPFQNWTRTSSELIGSVFIFTDYTMPVGELRTAFEDILRQTDLWDSNISNVQVTNSTNHSLEVRFLMSATDSPTLWDLRVFVREKIVEYMQQNHPDKLPRTRIFLNPEGDTNPEK